jgi:hypothetical protein
MRAVAGGALAIAAHTAVAQDAHRAPLTLEVRVRDMTGAPVAGARVMVVRGINDVRVASATDSAGLVRLALDSAEGDLQLVMRKIGYERADRFFRASPGSQSFDVTLRPVVTQLDPVRVTAQEDLKRRSYHIDADEIAAHADVVFDASDILAKLRPDMICGRSCRPMASLITRVQAPARACPSLAFLQPRATCPPQESVPSLATNVWVNGRRIRMVLPDEVAIARQHGVLAGLLPGTMTVLSEIKPEHIAEMTYLDSTDNTVGTVGSNDALFIVLKPGVAYEPGKPSYILSDSVARSSPATTASLPAYRYRLLGVYDQETGEPIAGAQVTDVSSGTHAETSATGTVTLVFLPEGGSPVRITKSGYDTLTLAVEIAPEITTPLTLVMTRHLQK